MALNVVGGLLFGQKRPSSGPAPTAFPSRAQDRIQNVRSSTDTHLVVYGTARVAVRPWVFAESTGSDSRFLHLIGPVAGHEVNDITVLLLDDESLEWGIDINDTTGVVDEEDGDRFSQSTRDINRNGPFVRVFKHLGESDQAADSTAVSDLPNWTTAHRGRGVAYIYMRLKYDKTAFQSGVPKTSVIVQGRKVWDPRDSSQDPDDTATHVFSNNWALCVLDYLRNRDFGLGATLDEIDLESFITAANISDEQVATGAEGSPSPTQARYTCDGVIDTGDDPIEIMENLLTAGAGALSYSQGKYHLFAGAFVTPTKTLTASDLAGPIEIQPRLPRANLFNAVRGTYVSPDDNHQPTDFPARTNALYEIEDGGEQIFRDIELPFTQDTIRAQRIAEIVLRKSRQGITVKFPAKLTALNIAVFDTVSVTLDSAGANFGWTNKTFRVLGFEYSAGLDEGLILSLQEDDATSYDWDGGTALTFDPAPNTTLPNPFSIPAPQNVSFASGDAELFVAGDGTVRPRIRVAWTLVDNIFVQESGEIEIQYRDAVFGGSPIDWDDGNTQTKVVGGNLTVAFLTDVEDGATYDIRLRSRTQIGAVSDQDGDDWLQSFQHTVVGKAAKPSAPDTFTVARLADGTRRFAWTHVTPPLDLKGYRIKHFTGTTSDWDAMTRLHPTGVLTESPYETNELAAGSYTFAIKAVDTSDNESADAVFITATIGDPRLREAVLQRLEHDLGFPGQKINGFVDGDGVLRSASDPGSPGGWDALPDAWDALPDTWDEILPQAVSMSYRVEIDLGVDLSFTPLVTVEGTGNAAVTMRTGADGDSPQISGPLVALSSVVGQRYLEIDVTVTPTGSPTSAMSIETLTILLDGEVKVIDIEDVDTAGPDTPTFERLGTGHFRVAPTEPLASITSASIKAFQNVGPGFTAEVISKAAFLGASPGNLSAEFKIYDATDALADATVDIELKGPSST